MNTATLVIMAAGIGSRFGGGIKQLEPVGPNGEIIMDYSIYDALKAGFDKVVFVIRKDIENDFKNVIGNRIEQLVDVEYAFQEKDAVPLKFKQHISTRQKPWGTGQAILCCKDLITSPFLVINADDYYGRDCYDQAFQYLTTAHISQDNKLNILMIGFILKNTLSKNGGVTRGICQTTKDNILTQIKETPNIIQKDSRAYAVTDTGKMRDLDINSLVSMNMWGLNPDIFGVLENGFSSFLESLAPGNDKAEYLLPNIISQLVENGQASVQLLPSHDSWFGVTYKEDKEAVTSAIQILIQKGIYPSRLYR